MATKLKRKTARADGTATSKGKPPARRAQQKAKERAVAVEANRQKSRLIAAAAVLESELDKERGRGPEVIDDDADVLHP